MKAVVQRVTSSCVRVRGQVVGSIRKGINLLLGVAAGDTEEDMAYLASKVANLRIFEDGEGKLNLSLLDIGGEALVISQFTLLGDCRKGRRPSFTLAARPETAGPMYEEFVRALRSCGVKKVETGVFGADMAVEIVNDGPVTLLIDTKQR